MTRWAIAYGATGLAFLALDSIWLGLATPHIYRPAMGTLMAERFNIPAAIAFYAIYVAGIAIFAVHPAVRAQSAVTAALLGAALGLVAYATYDLTNLATLRGWPAKLAIIDLIWGTLVTAMAALAGYWTAIAAAKAG